MIASDSSIQGKVLDQISDLSLSCVCAIYSSLNLEFVIAFGQWGFIFDGQGIGLLLGYAHQEQWKLDTWYLWLFLNWSKDIFSVPIFGSKKRSLKPRFCVALNIMAVDKIPANQPSLIKAFPKWIGPRDSCGVSYHALVDLKINWPAVTCFLGKRKTCLQWW